MSERLINLAAEDDWFVLPAANRPKRHSGPAMNDTSFVRASVAPNSKSLYLGFRTVKRK